MEINFFPKGHSRLTSFSFIDNLKKPACDSKQDKLQLATLRYIKVVQEIYELPNQAKPTQISNSVNQKEPTTGLYYKEFDWNVCNQYQFLVEHENVFFCSFALFT